MRVTTTALTAREIARVPSLSLHLPRFSVTPTVIVPIGDYDPNDPTNPVLLFGMGGNVYLDDYTLVGTYSDLLTSGELFQPLGQAGQLADTELESAVLNMAVADTAYVGGWYAPEIAGAASDMMQTAGGCRYTLILQPEVY